MERSSKKASNKNRSPAELKKCIKAQVAAEEKAHKIVEKLVLEDIVSEDYLTNSVGLITPSHYSDVTVERSISKICGYPLCSNHLSQVPKQQYKISTKTNRVYDITERKCFCSNFCFKASKYLESQIPTSPVWTRDIERICVKLLKKGDHDHKSQSLGEGEVLVGRNEAESNVENEGGFESLSVTSVTKNAHEELDYGMQCCESVLLPENKTRCELNDEQITDTKRPEIRDLAADISEAVATQVCGRCQMYNEYLHDINKDQVSDNCNREKEKSMRQSNAESYQSKKELKDSVNSAEALKNSAPLRQLLVNSLVVLLNQWSTQSTLEYLHLVKAKGQDFQSKEEQEKKTLEDRSKSNMENFTEKMRQFYTRFDDDSDGDEGEDKELPDKKITEKDVSIKEHVLGENEKSSVVVPLIDSKSQVTIRRRIVLRKLTQILPDLLQEIRLTMAEISGDLRELVYTFSLSNHNVVLRPPQWNMLAILLIYMLRNLNISVRNSLKYCSDNFHALLSRLGVSIQDLDRVLGEVYKSEMNKGEENKAEFFVPEQMSSIKIDEETIKQANEVTNYGEMEELD